MMLRLLLSLILAVGLSNAQGSQPTKAPTITSVPAPTKASVPPPTKAPVPPPTKAPVPAPTQPPPTKAPVPPPTKAPVPAPTQRPPTKAPVPPPTRPPTTKAPQPTASSTVQEEPTDPPVPPPTRAPTTRPPTTKAPVPTASPVPPPTRAPTTRPPTTQAPVPTKSPTRPPTTRPPTTLPPTTRPPTTRPPTARPPTTRPPTTRPPTTRPPTTSAPAPTVTSPTTSAPVPTASSPTTTAPVPTAAAPTTAAPQPTASPTRPETPEPTDPPTKEPTDSPTKEPTEEPTKSPTKSPTPWPTRSPTTRAPVPTESPTSRPTASPTVSPTNEPTTSPSASPSVQPTKEPTSSPTVAPTGPPTVPTNSPTSQPVTLGGDETQNVPNGIVTGIVMKLSDVGPLSAQELTDWARVTEVHMTNEVMTAVGTTNAQVQVTFVSQKPPFEGSASRRSLRQLQGQEQEIVFDGSYTFSSTMRMDGLDGLVVGAFVSSYKRTLYLERLVTYGGDAFGGVSAVSVEVNDESVSTNEASGRSFNKTTSSPGGKSINVGVFVGVMTACIISLIVAVAFYARRRRTRVPSIVDMEADEIDENSCQTDVVSNQSNTIDDGSVYTMKSLLGKGAQSDGYDNMSSLALSSTFADDDNESKISSAQSFENANYWENQSVLDWTQP